MPFWSLTVLRFDLLVQLIHYEDLQLLQPQEKISINRQE